MPGRAKSEDAVFTAGTALLRSPMMLPARRDLDAAAAWPAYF